MMPATFFTLNGVFNHCRSLHPSPMIHGLNQITQLRLLCEHMIFSMHVGQKFSMGFDQWQCQLPLTHGRIQPADSLQQICL